MSPETDQKTPSGDEASRDPVMSPEADQRAPSGDRPSPAEKAAYHPRRRAVPFWLRPPLFLLHTVRYLFVLFWLIYQSFVSVFWERRKSKKLIFQIFLQQIYFTAIQSLPLTVLIAIVVGALLMREASIILPTYGFPDYAEWITVQLVFREIAPVVVALVIVARSANAIVIEIGNMKVNGELRALDVLGFNLDYFIVLPRILAMIVSVTTLTVCFCAAALWGGFWTADVLDLLESNFILVNLEKNFTLEILGNILLRAAGFGVIISSVACLHGLGVRISPTEVPQQASGGVVRALSLCFAFNFVVSVYF